jgi:two-component sensor histidine kinase
VPESCGEQGVDFADHPVDAPATIMCRMAWRHGRAQGTRCRRPRGQAGVAFDPMGPDRAVPFGLLANELLTNAIKHAFPDGTGRVVLTVERTGDQIEFTVADNGVGLPDKRSANIADTHGSDYVTIFVRQLGGTIAVLGPEGTGTTIRIQIPLH